MAFREIRVRPVVRYIVTDYNEDDAGKHTSIEFGQFDNVHRANVVAYAMAEAEAMVDGTSPKLGVIVEPARALKIHWLRGPGEPKEAIRWELVEEDIVAPAQP